MIPININYEAIIDAMKRIDNEGVPKRRKSKKYILEFNGKQYPPKYTIARANQIVNNEFLESNVFSGGRESN
jgi:hypothetical protein